MDYLEIKEGKISLKGIVLDEKTQYGIKALSLIWGIELKETCDRINRALQAFSDIWDTLKELAERILEVLPHFAVDYERGVLKPIVEVEVNGEYGNEEDTE